MRKTLFISDMDGTLLDAGAQLSPFSREALGRLLLHGLPFTIATARPHASVARIIGDLPLRLPMILMNGALIYDPVRKGYLRAEHLSAQATRVVLVALRRHGLGALMYKLEEDRLLTYHEPLGQGPLADFLSQLLWEGDEQLVCVDEQQAKVGEGALYFTLRDTRERLLPLLTELSALPQLGCALYRDVYGEGHCFLEVMSANANKRSAARWLRDAYGYEYLVCFGDNHNDLPLFEAGNLRLAVNNAVPELEAQAHQVIPANTEDGVARWLMEHITPIYMVRHAQSDHAVHEDMARPLTEEGKRAAAELAEAMRHIPLDLVFSSPYLRAHDTVAPLAAQRGLPISTVDDLRERRVDSQWIDDYMGFARRQWADFDYKLQGGECLREVQARNLRALGQLLDAHRGRSMAIGTHGTALAAILNGYDSCFGYRQFLGILPKLPYIARLLFLDDEPMEACELPCVPAP